MDFEHTVRKLEAALAGSLPGVSAQDLLTPQPRREWPPGFNPARIRHAAGLLLLFPCHNRPCIVLTVRADTVGRHAGQVSLPGGVIDQGETFEQAALREAHEEVGLSLERVRTLGALSPIDIPVSGFRLHPIVAVATERPALHPADGEVARILEVAIDELMNPRAIVRKSLTRDGRAMQVPALRACGVDIWGATAMVLAEFLTLLGWTAASVE